MKLKYQIILAGALLLLLPTVVIAQSSNFWLPVGTSLTPVLPSYTIKLPSQTSGCAQFGSTGILTSTGSNCGSGGGSSFGYPFPNNATSTPLEFDGGIVNSQGTSFLSADGSTLGIYSTVDSTAYHITAGDDFIGIDRPIDIQTPVTVNPLLEIDGTAPQVGDYVNIIGSTNIFNINSSGLVKIGNNFSIPNTGTSTLSYGTNLTSGCYAIAGICVGSSGGSGSSNYPGTSTNPSMASNFVATSTTATSTFANGISISRGCFSFQGGCLATTTIKNNDSSLTISPTSGAVVASINTANSLTWTNPQYFQGNGGGNTSIEIICPLATCTGQGIDGTDGGDGADSAPLYIQSSGQGLSGGIIPNVYIGYCNSDCSGATIYLSHAGSTGGTAGNTIVGMGPTASPFTKTGNLIDYGALDIGTTTLDSTVNIFGATTTIAAFPTNWTRASEQKTYLARIGTNPQGNGLLIHGSTAIADSQLFNVYSSSGSLDFAVSDTGISVGGSNRTSLANGINSGGSLNLSTETAYDVFNSAATTTSAVTFYDNRQLIGGERNADPLVRFGGGAASQPQLTNSTGGINIIQQNNGSGLSFLTYATTTTSFGNNFTMLSGQVNGFGSTTPEATLSVVGTSTNPSAPLSVVASSTGQLYLKIDNKGNEYTGGDTPAVACTPSGGSVAGDNDGGAITTGTLSTSCTMTFADGGYQAVGTMWCIPADNSATVSFDVSSISNTAVTFSTAGSLTGTIYYNCGEHITN